MTATCGAQSLWPNITCQKPSGPVHENHEAEDSRSIYLWTTAAVEAKRRGDCPGYQRTACVWGQPCSCGQHERSTR